MLKARLEEALAQEEVSLNKTERAEFENHMIAETVYTILAITDPRQSEALGIQMAAGSLETVLFPTLSTSVTFNKVVCEHAPLVDWKDNLQVLKFVPFCLTSTIVFISRPLNE